jgi:peptidoglycan/xylan/chitin deacetylase (PgdA/CDA1 family)
MDFKSAAVSIVFDDNSSNQFEIAEPMMNARGIRGTFFVVPDWSLTVWDSIQSASRHGHEIGSHTMTHPNMSALGDSDLAAAEKELRDSRDTIEHRLPGTKCLTFAWPFNRYSPKVEKIAAKYYISARQGEGTFEVSSPNDFYAIRSIPFTDTADQMNRFLDDAIRKKRWFIELLHRVHPDPYTLTYTNDDSLRIHLDYLVAKRDSAWIAPYGEVIRYIKERDSSSFVLKEDNDSSMVFALTNDLDSSIYNLPLSLEVPLWGDARIESAWQGKDSLPIRDWIENDKKSIRINAYPNKGDILLRGSKLGSAVKPTWLVERKAENWVTHESNDPSTLVFRPPYAGTFTVKVFDAIGKERENDFVFRAEPGYAYRLELRNKSYVTGKSFVSIYSGQKAVMSFRISR